MCAISLSKSKLRGYLAAFVASLLLLSGVVAHADALDDIRAAGSIRVCADPHNLPYSDMAMAPAGYDLEIAAEIARALEVRLEYLWFHSAYGRRMLRQLYEKNCDFVMGLPASIGEGAPRLVLSRPYARLAFVPVVRSGSGIRGIEALRGHKVGVEMMSVADFYLFRQAIPRDLYRSQGEMVNALLDGRLQAAMMWLPAAAWEIKQRGNTPLEVLPATDAALQFSLAVALRREDAALRERIDAILERLEAEGVLARIFERYGLAKSSNIVP